MNRRWDIITIERGADEFVQQTIAAKLAAVARRHVLPDHFSWHPYAIAAARVGRSRLSQ